MRSMSLRKSESILDFGLGAKEMIRRSWMRWLDSFCDNQQSKIQNPIWVGLLALVIAFVGLADGAGSQPAKIPRIGYLSAGTLSSSSANVEAFRQGLRELGYTEGKNIIIEWRSAEGKLDRLPKLAAELVGLKVDVIFAAAAPSIKAASLATRTIPIVFEMLADPVSAGFVSSLAKPGGNLTGLAGLAPELSGKRLELLKEILPRLKRVTILGNPSNPNFRSVLKETESAASALGLQLQVLQVKESVNLPSAFAAMNKARAEALSVIPDPLLVSEQKRIIDLAAKGRLPAIYGTSLSVDAGGLISYAPSPSEMFKRAATYVDKILKGSKPADLPVEQPIKFEFIVNLKAAKQIGLTIPPNVLVRADRVIR
jgi:putative ABC transport system substrate-binding protein